MKEHIIFPYIPDSGPNDQKFDFWSDENTFTRHLCNSVEESIESIEKLLSKRPHSISEIIKETGQPKEIITKAVARIVDQGKAAIDSFKLINAKSEEERFEAQLKLF